MEGEVGPSAIWRRWWCWVVIGVVGDGIRWSGSHNLISELGSLFVRVVEQWDKVVASKVAGG